MRSGPRHLATKILDTLKEWGIRIVRVWAHWSEPIYGRDGALTAQGRLRLRALVDTLQRRGMVLELVLLRPGQLPGERYTAFSSVDTRTRAVESITTALRDDRNVLFDLYNEHDHPHGPISHADARVLRDTVKRLDSQRLVTISSTGTHLITPEGRIDEGGEQNLRAEISREAGGVAVDVLAPHLPRTRDWAAATGPRLSVFRAALHHQGVTVPICLNEEQRTDTSAPLAPEAYVRAVTEARRAGAAAWLFHTAAGFQLRDKTFVAALGANERAALAVIRRTQ